MPELPEVEVLRRGLIPAVVGRRLGAAFVSGKPLRRQVPQQALADLCGRRITAVERRAKYLLLLLDSGDTLVFHLGMSGNLGIFTTESPRRRHDHLELLLDNRTCLRLHDPRRFGMVVLLPAGDGEARQRLFATCGPEPLEDGFSATWLRTKAERRRVAVKPFIMNSTVVVGVGNIYANESLFAAGIRPTRSVARIRAAEWERLAEAIRTTLTAAIACGGSTISDFRNAGQQKGYFQINFNVYGRSGEPCPQCSGKIEKEVITGRASFFCRSCQQ